MSELTFVELFAGIGGFALGLERAGWKGLWANENNAFCCKVYRERFPDTRLDERDIREVQPSDIPAHTLLTAGFPCQDLSVAGKRKGIRGERSGLFFEIVRLLEGTRTPWILLENVPGLLSANAGRDFAVVLGALDEIGYGLSWRVLDAQHFGVPQRRRRVFIVGCLGAPCPPEILLEPKGVQGDSAAGGQAGQDIAHSLETRSSDGRLRENATYVIRTSHTAANQTGWRTRATYALESAEPGQAVIPINEQVATRHKKLGRGTGFGVGEPGDPAFTIGANHPHAVACPPTDPDGVREASGLPRRVDVPVFDQFNFQVTEGKTGTLISQGEVNEARGCNRIPLVAGGGGGGACECPDGRRYKTLGNAVAVPVVEWIGRRLKAAVEQP